MSDILSSFLDSYVPPDPSAMVAQPDESSLFSLPGAPGASGGGFLSSITGGGPAAPGAIARAPTLPPVVNLPTSGRTGISGVLTDITDLVSRVYQGEAQVEAAKAQTDIARAQSNLALANIKGAPTIWTILGIGAAGLFLLELAGRGGGKGK